MYWLVIKDKLLHVITKLQFLMTSQWKNVNALPIPDNIQLNNVAPEVIASLNISDKLAGKYETARLMLVLRLKMGENGVIQLLGIGCRSWDQPTLSLDQAMTATAGMEYKSFQLLDDLSQYLTIALHHLLELSGDKEAYW